MTVTRAVGMGSILVGVLALASIGPNLRASAASKQEDYPTAVLTDYVNACVKANGDTPETLAKCTCSIAVVQTLLPYDAYEEADTFLSLGQLTGETGSVFRTSEMSKNAITRLRQAQIEADLRCF